MPEPRPNAEYIHEFFRHLHDEVWADARANWEDYDRYFNRTYQVWPAGVNRPTYRPARPATIVNNATDHQLAFEPKVTYFPASPRVEDKDAADRVERFLKNALDTISLREPSILWKQVGKNSVHYAYTVVEGPYLDFTDEPIFKDIPGESRAQRRAREQIHEADLANWLPFRGHAPHPSTILLDPQEMRPRRGIKATRRSNIDLYELTAARARQNMVGFQWPFPPPGEFYRLVPALEYWSDDWHAMVVDSPDTARLNPTAISRRPSLLFVEDNTWSFNPFNHAYAGFGQEIVSQSGYDGAFRAGFNPASLAQGILHHVRDTIRMQAQTVSGWANAVDTAGFPKIITPREAIEIQTMLARSDILEGMNWQDFRYAETPPVPNFLFEIERFFDGDIEEGTFARALAGIREQGVSTVGQQAILSTAAGRKFVAPSRQLDRLATHFTSNLLRLIKLLNRPLQIADTAVRPSDIQHFFVQVTFELIDPVLQLERQRLGLQELAAGAISLETYWSAYSRLADATGEKRRILQELVERSPQVQQALARIAAQEAGLDDILERLQNQQAGGGVNGGGGPLQAAAQGMAQARLRQGLTPQIASPGRVNPTAAQSL